MSLKIGLQMFTVRGEMAKDPVDTTEAVIDMGYRYLEYANLTHGDPGVGFPVDPGELRATVDAAGGNVVSTHIWPVDESTISEILAYHKDLGTQFIVSKLMYDTFSDLLDIADTCCRVGERIREAGMRHLIHTSVMRTRDGRTDLDEILDRVPTELLDVELDTYWALRSGLDPVEMIHRYGERITILHQKDLPAEIEQPVDIAAVVADDYPLSPAGLYYDPRYVGEDNFVEVGSGVMQLQAIIDAANNDSRAEYLFVEQDFTRIGELASARLSLDALRGRTGVDLEGQR